MGLPRVYFMEVRERADFERVLQILGETPRKAKNGALVIRCPFHIGWKSPGREKTPSLRISLDAKAFTCHSCHESGDVFAFVKKYRRYHGKRKHLLLRFFKRHFGIAIPDQHYLHLS